MHLLCTLHAAPSCHKRSCASVSLPLASLYHLPQSGASISICVHVLVLLNGSDPSLMSYQRLQDPEEFPLRPLPRSQTVRSDPSVYSVSTNPAEYRPQPERRRMVNFKKGFTTQRPSVRAILSYAPDWALCIILAAAFYALDKIPGFKRDFSLTDTSILHKHAVHERVPPWMLYIIFAAAPLVIAPIANVLTVRSWWDFHSSWLAWLLSTTITGAITQFTKVTVGRPRPDLIDRCQPMAGAVDPPLGLSTEAICTQTDVALLRDGFRSFPSGHSSLSFAGLGFLTFYLAGKLHLFDEKGHTAKAWIALAPLAGAALVAISRTMDYRHHWQDVLTGSLLGLVVSYFSYRQYYPPLISDLSHQPYPPRFKRGGHELPTHTSTAPAMVNRSFDNENIRLRPFNARYSDGPADEEMGIPQTTSAAHNTDAPKAT
ncbi:phosphatidic acid phosphatase type 2/haloperoxidase [Earliella scabrosa]|nr:phosphatidic acid phosphatase type 2/haloperoxidase [Earliella scabrosa]